MVDRRPERTHMNATRLIIGIAAVVVGGCASIPENISTPVPGPDVREVRADPGRYTGARVRWGGTISEVKNLEDRTVIAVVARPLARNGEPLGGEAALGRFFAEVGRFLDPEEYKTGRRITVVGRFTGIRQSRIDEYLYDYPVVQVEHLYLWREYARRDPYPMGPYYRPFPYWYDPYWRHYHGYMYHPWHYY